MEAADDEPVTSEIGHGQREALVTARVLERVEPDETDPLDRPAPVRLQDRGFRRQLIELAGDRVDLVEMGIEDGLEAAPVRIASDPVEAATEPAQAASLGEDRQEEHEKDDHQRGDDRSDIGRDQGVEVDLGVSDRRRTQWFRGAPSLTGGQPPETRPVGRCYPPRVPANPAHGGVPNPMAKRSRIGGRPGQRRPIQRPANRSVAATPTAPTAPTRRPDGVTPEEEARAAELEAAILVEEKAAEEALRRNNADRRGRAPVDRTTYAPSSLSVRASEEYAYVRRDVRRIAIVGGGLLAILAVLDILVNVAHVITI
jgi:hypothetical protein